MRSGPVHGRRNAQTVAVAGDEAVTDRINALTLVLDRDIRDDDIEFLRQACMVLKHVSRVELNVADIGQLVAETRVRS